MRRNIDQQLITDYNLWDAYKGTHKLHTLTFEITERCNFDCRHCYVNQPAGDRQHIRDEISADFISGIADEAMELGAVWSVLTGGEPLLRKDFKDIYLNLKRKGLLVLVFTNASLLTREHIDLFKAYPPYALEVTIYGATPQTFERVTQQKGSFAQFKRGLNLLFSNNIPVRLKAMALRSNIHEMSEISKFARQYTSDYYRFDPQLHLRYDFDPVRNEMIKSERLTPQQVVDLENQDDQRREALAKNCHKMILSGADREHSCLINCGAGNGSAAVSFNGMLKLCQSMVQPEFMYDLKQGTLKEAWTRFIPSVRRTTTQNKDYLERCHNCRLINLCSWCPAHAYLETGKSDQPVDSFCRVAHARAANLQKIKSKHVQSEK